jgi:hypothetical protein
MSIVDRSPFTIKEQLVMSSGFIIKDKVAKDMTK